MKKYLIIIFIFMITLNVNATCYSDDLKLMKEQVSGIEFKKNYTLDINKDEKKVTTYYTISIINKDSSFKYQYRLLKDKNYIDISDKEEFGTFEGGNKVIVNILGSGECSNTIIKSRTVDLIPYNSLYYFNKDTCQKYPDYRYCEEWINTLNISQETFNKNLDIYINQLNKKNKDKFDIKEFLSLLVKIIISIIIIIVVVIFIIKKTKKDPFRR